MGKNAELLSTLREYLRETPVAVITEDIEPEVIAQIDIRPLQLERTNKDGVKRRFLISIGGYAAGATRGTEPERPGGFDGGTEFVSRNSSFWDMPEEELLKYRVDFTPTKKSDIPNSLPDYKGLVYEPGGLNAAWGDDWDDSDESSGDNESDIQARLDAGLDIDSEDNDISKVYDADTNRWIDVPSDELPPKRPVGSFGYPRLQRKKTKGGQYKYSVYKRPLPGVFAQRSSHHRAGSKAIKTPWMMFMDWWHVTWNIINKSASERYPDVVGDILELVGGTDKILQDPSRMRPGQENRSQMSIDLMKSSADIKKKIKLAKKEGKSTKKLENALEYVLFQHKMLSRYGLLGTGDDMKEVDYTKPPLENGRHPRKYRSLWADKVDDINANPQRHVMSRQDVDDWQYGVNLIGDTSDVPAWADVDNPLNVSIDPMWGNVRAADLAKQQRADRAASYHQHGVDPHAPGGVKRTPGSGGTKGEIESLPGNISNAFKNAYRERLTRRKQYRELIDAGVDPDEAEKLLDDTVKEGIDPELAELMAKHKPEDENIDADTNAGSNFDLAKFASSRNPKDDDSDSDVGYETHCKKCKFRASIYGKNNKEGNTRGKSPDLIDDDAHVIKFILNMDLSSLGAKSGKWEIAADAARNLMKLLQDKVGVPSWLNMLLSDKKYDISHAEKHNAPSILNKPISETYGRILFTTQVRQLGYVPGYENMESPYNYPPESKEFAALTRKVVGSSENVGGDPAPLGHISSFDIQNTDTRKLTINPDPASASMYDARKRASSDPEVRAEAEAGLKEFIRNWFGNLVGDNNSGSMGAAKSYNISRGQSKVKAIKDRQWREKQVGEFNDYISIIKDKANNWITLNGITVGYTDEEILEALSQAFSNLKFQIEPIDLTVDKFDELSWRIREKILKFLDNVSKNVEVELGNLLEGIRKFATAVELGDHGRAILAKMLIEDACIFSDMGGLEEDISQLLRYKSRCNYARRIFIEDSNLYASALILNGYSRELAFTIDCALSESELNEIFTFKSGVVNESVQPIVQKASQILAIESYRQALNVFRRVVPRLGINDLKYLPIIAPQKIINDGRLRDASLESILNDIGLNSNIVLSNSKNGNSTAIWAKIGNL